MDRDEALNPAVLQVVAGVVHFGGKILLARRAPGKHLAGYWEFPGGKVETGETHQQCLARELQEEFDLIVNIQTHIGSERFTYADRVIELHGYYAEAEALCTAGNSHDLVDWICPHQLKDYEVAPADVFLVEAILASDGSPKSG